MSKPSRRQTLRRFALTFGLELAIYGVLLAVYFLLVLRFLGEPLVRLFDDNLVIYAAAALGLIVAQGVVLDFVTSLLIRLLNVDALDRRE
jgi:putative flippase GtrA